MIKKVSQFLNLFDQIMRSKATDLIAFETNELENIFGILVLGSFLGIPTPPAQITLDLLPDLEKNLILMLNKTGTASAPLSELFSRLSIE